MAASATNSMGADYSSTRRTSAASPTHSVEFRGLPPNYLGTFQALDAMRLAVLGAMPPDFSGYADSFNKGVADAICNGAVGLDTRPDSAQIAALFDFVSHSLAYVPHPFNQQVVQDCRRTIEIGSGDCVSKSVCLATLLACQGIRSRFVVQNDGDEFFHVYVEALTPSGWMALDPVATDEAQGWTQPLPDGGFQTTWEIFGV